MKKKEKYLRLDTIYIDRHYSISIPPTEKDIDRNRKLREKIGNRKLIQVCCNDIVNIMNKTLEIGITQQEFDVFLLSFRTHNITRFQFSEYRIGKSWKIRIDEYIDDIFETTELFEKYELQIHFLESAFEDIQEKNTHMRWAKALRSFNKKFQQRVEEWKNNQNNITYSLVILQNINRLKYLIRKNSFEEIFLILQPYTNEYNRIILLENNWSQIKNSFYKGLITYEEYSIRQNKIALELLNLFDVLEREA